MEVDKLWEFKEEVEIMEEEDTGGVLQTRERKKKLLEHGNGEGEEELKAGEEAVVLEDHKSVFFDPTKGLWKCRHCDWTYRLSSPCRNSILNHQGHCQIARDLESLVRNGSFYGSPSKVSDHLTEVSGGNGVTEVMQFGTQKEESNETSTPKTKELETQENENAQETNHNSNNGKLENGSHSNGRHEVSNSSGTMTIANGKAGLQLIATIDENMANSNGALDISNGSMRGSNGHQIVIEKDEHATKGKVSIEEYDLEKILDEQETHDLYCPNCNSCITRRVILRKRKRTVPQTKRDEPPKKPQLAGPSANASNQPVTERHEQESPDIFRCLSCFSFFIPTGCGFNIFRIFGRTEVNQEVQVQDSSAPREMPESENCGTWLLSCFQSGDSPKKADAVEHITDPAKEPLLSDTQSSNGTTASAAASTSSVQSHVTVVKPEQSKKPLPAASSSQLQTTETKNEEEMKPSFGELHGTSISWVESHTASAAIKISPGKSETGFAQTDVTHVVVRQDAACKDKFPLSKPTGETVLDATLVVQETLSENGSFFSPAIPTLDVKVESPGKTEIVPEMGSKPIPLVSQGQAIGPAASPHLVLPIPDAAETLTPPTPRSDRRDEWDILKAIVYGGLVESITSLSIVSAAAASGGKTLNIFILAIANLLGGLPIIFHNIADMRDLGDVDVNDEQLGHYWLQLGRRSKHRLHMVMAMLSYILFGLLPPVIYGLSFRKVDNRENKMMAVAAASLVCIALLAVGKAHVKRTRTYIKTLMYYLTIGVSSSGLSYVAGVLITRLLEHFGLIDQGASAPPAPPSLLFPYAAAGAKTSAWASY